MNYSILLDDFGCLVISYYCKMDIDKKKRKIHGHYTKNISIGIQMIWQLYPKSILPQSVSNNNKKQMLRDLKKNNFQFMDIQKNSFLNFLPPPRIFMHKLELDHKCADLIKHFLC